MRLLFLTFIKEQWIKQLAHQHCRYKHHGQDYAFTPCVCHYGFEAWQSKCVQHSRHLASPAKEVILLEHKYSLDQAQSKTTGDTSYYYIILLHHTTTSYYIVLTVMSPRSSPMISSASAESVACTCPEHLCKMRTSRGVCRLCVSYLNKLTRM